MRQNKDFLYIKKSDLMKKLSEMYDQGYKDAQKRDKSDIISSVLIFLLGIPCKVLADKYGWGLKKRIPEFAEAVVDAYEQFDQNVESLEQMRDWIFETTGIKFEEGDYE